MKRTKNEESRKREWPDRLERTTRGKLGAQFRSCGGGGELNPETERKTLVYRCAGLPHSGPRDMNCHTSSLTSGVRSARGRSLVESSWELRLCTAVLFEINRD